MKELCVVHLVRQQNGIEPFARFLASYRQNPGGVEHDLLIVFKGFDATNPKDEYLKLLGMIQHLTLDIPDIGLDITAYLTAARSYEGVYRYFCFLNSFSVILDSEWLRKLYLQIVRPDVGLVGATGSWQSHRGNAPIWQLSLGFSYCYFMQRRKHYITRAILRLFTVYQQNEFLIHFDPFPNCHIRTNAFMVSDELMKTFKGVCITTKQDAYKFESGKSGLTKKVLGMGKKAVVVGRDGEGYDPQQWNVSRVFWQCEQSNLLVGDNQTRDYQFADSKRRDYLSMMAWGYNDGS